MQIVITGVAGYIGAHVANYFLTNGAEVIGVDNLSTGEESFIDERINFVKGDVQDLDTLRLAMELLHAPQNSAVIHCAGLKFAGESVKNPLEFYENNTFATSQLLKVMKEFQIPRLVFSSSCSVYGDVKANKAINEADELDPVSPYGKSKYYAEEIIRDHVKHNNLKAIVLRYFNVVGNSDILAFDKSKFNLFPNLYRAIQYKNTFEIYGKDHDTADGTCIRDYVDINPLSKTHFDAFKLLDNSDSIFSVYNLGSGEGLSVLQIVNKAKELIAPELEYRFMPKREGDPAKIFADTTNAIRDLGWNNGSSLDAMLLSGWKAWEKGALN